MENHCKKISTQELEIVDERGVPRIVLSVSHDGPQIELCDRQGYHRAALMIDQVTDEYLDEYFEAKFFSGGDLVASFQVWPEGELDLFLSPHGEGRQLRINLNEVIENLKGVGPHGQRTRAR